MATLYEHYNTPGLDDSWYVFQTDQWLAQTFTPSVIHQITLVKLLLFKSEIPHTVTVGIRATNGAGEPTGDDLTSASFDGNTLTAAKTGEWKEIPLPACLVDAGVKYAIVVREHANAKNYVCWRHDETDPIYPGGECLGSVDSGGTWTHWAGVDNMFEEWGEPIVAPINKAYALSREEL